MNLPAIIITILLVILLTPGFSAQGKEDISVTLITPKSITYASTDIQINYTKTGGIIQTYLRINNGPRMIILRNKTLTFPPGTHILTLEGLDRRKNTYNSSAYFLVDALTFVETDEPLLGPLVLKQSNKLLKQDELTRIPSIQVGNGADDLEIIVRNDGKSLLSIDEISVTILGESELRTPGAKIEPGSTRSIFIPVSGLQKSDNTAILKVITNGGTKTTTLIVKESTINLLIPVLALLTILAILGYLQFVLKEKRDNL